MVGTARAEGQNDVFAKKTGAGTWFARQKRGVRAMNEQFPILIAEDQDNEAALLQRALREVGFNNPFHISKDGMDVIGYLKGDGPYVDRTRYRFPRMLFVDLRMPGMTGFELLAWLKEQEGCDVIPRIVLSTSREQADIQKAYKMGANSYIYKPPTFAGFVERLQLVFDYWEMCEKPSIQAI